MFKFKRLLLLCLLFTITIYINASTISIKISHPVKDTNVLIHLNSESKPQTVTINQNGEGSIVINEKAQYASIQYKRIKSIIYLKPNQDLSISLDTEKTNGQITFGGKNAPINNYLNSGKIKYPSFNRSEVTEHQCIAKLDSLFAENTKQLNATNLPKDFITIETLRQKYDIYSSLSTYYNKNSYTNTPFNPSEEFFHKIKELAVIDANLLNLTEYKYFINNAAILLATQQNVNDKENRTNMFIDYIENNINDSQIAEFLLNNYALETISSKGIANSERLVAAFNKIVKKEAYITAFKAAYDRWDRIKPGKPSPSFSLLDINGKRVTLNDLKGKIVYIDVWATWCAPCCRELPHLKTLEEKYGEKEICFVSISCDKNKKIWEQMVQKKELKGIQLHFGEDPNFLESYMVRGIPRFILIDREGIIIDAETTRPSDPKTIETLNLLLAK